MFEFWENLPLAMLCSRSVCYFLNKYWKGLHTNSHARYVHEMIIFDIGLAQPGLPGGAFGASLQGPGKEVVEGPASRRTRLAGITCVSTA